MVSVRNVAEEENQMIRMAHITGSFRMTSTRPLLAAVLLAATVVCPVALAHHRPGHGGGGGGGDNDTWSFHAESSGHVYGYYDSKEYNVSGDVHNLVFNKRNGNEYWFSDYFRDWDYNGRSGWECFTDSTVDPVDENPNLAGTMQLYEFGNEPELVARLWFRAGNDPDDPADKIHDIQYVLDLYNESQGWTGPFPPDKVPAPASWRVATHWELRTAKRGSLRNEPCVTGNVVPFGIGDVYFEVEQNP